MTPDVVDEARDWLESWPGPLKLVGGSRAQQVVPDAHNAAPDLITRLVDEIELLRSVQGLSVNIPEHGEWGSETLAYLFLDFGIQPGDGYDDAVARQGNRERELAAAKAAVQAVRDALSGHPRCDEHPDGDVITCGWKKAVASVQWALDSLDGVDTSS